ncbi:MAG: ATP phosphoribosyltransferase regulatory subunit [Burkholderiaceae bacterium]|nr:ATP phosphoribosyltransferase regulatory subunit [Aquabacterium sp.]NUP84324.1 ATP phosphoribosyltransferase regulatory subunit [Burkholderiaceae bacterium]
MTSAWLLPEHIADVLPSEARRIEELRRQLLERAGSYGFELVIPPLLEHLESLLTGAGHALDLRTFKLVDQLSGRTLGLRADATPQVARIDAHLLNRQGVARLCYCGPVLHTRPQAAHATREPLQLGAEIYGHPGLEADFEIQELALDCLGAAGVAAPVIDISDVRILRSALVGVALEAAALDDVVSALAAKDAPALRSLARSWPIAARRSIEALPELYGDLSVLDRASRELGDHAGFAKAINEMRWLAEQVGRAHPAARVGFDLADMGGYGYYSGVRFAIYAHGAADAVLRGGRYDEVGAVFGRNRPAVGFSADLKVLAELMAPEPPRCAVLAPWSDDTALRAVVRELRQQGETVVYALPGHEHEGEEYACDRELVSRNGNWELQALPAR